MNKKANRLYNHCLQSIIRVMGEGSTDGQALQQVGEHLFGTTFAGVFARDELPNVDTIANHFTICNLDSRGMVGSHWVATGCGMMYDSFGRDLNFHGFGLTDQDAEQHITELNCGQRCLAWLCVCFAYGPDGAFFI